jgi:hypothetical protein
MKTIQYLYALTFISITHTFCAEDQDHKPHLASVEHPVVAIVHIAQNTLPEGNYMVSSSAEDTLPEANHTLSSSADLAHLKDTSVMPRDILICPVKRSESGSLFKVTGEPVFHMIQNPVDNQYNFMEHSGDITVTHIHADDTTENHILHVGKNNSMRTNL